MVVDDPSRTLKEGNGVPGSYLLAIMTLELQIILVNHLETGGYTFMIGDAVRVEAFYDLLYAVGHLHFLLFDNLEVLNDDQRSRRGNKRDLVDLVRTEEFIAYLDDAFLSHLPAVEVGAEGHLVGNLAEV